jgi:hypothetical protein
VAAGLLGGAVPLRARKMQRTAAAPDAA